MIINDIQRNSGLKNAGDFYRLRFCFYQFIILYDYLIEFQFQIGRIRETKNAFDHISDISPKRLTRTL
jgi:hypothetical protein